MGGDERTNLAGISEFLLLFGDGPFVSWVAGEFGCIDRLAKGHAGEVRWWALLGRSGDKDKQRENRAPWDLVPLSLGGAPDQLLVLRNRWCDRNNTNVSAAALVLLGLLAGAKGSL